MFSKLISATLVAATLAGAALLSTTSAQAGGYGNQAVLEFDIARAGVYRVEPTTFEDLFGSMPYNLFLEVIGGNVVEQMT